MGSWQVEALLEIAKGKSRAGQRRDAQELLDKVRKEAERLDDNWRAGNSKASALSRLARAQGELGEEHAALAWIEEHPSHEVKAWSMLGLAQGVAKRLPPRPVLSAASKEPAPNEDSSRATARKIAAPQVRKLSGSFKGKIILFGTGRDDHPDSSGIEAINPDGTGLETILVLDKNEHMNAGRESPDGTRLAFTLTRGRGATERNEVWVVTAGGQRRRIDDGQVVAWSPDGTRLATFRSKDRQIENIIFDVTTGRATLLAVPKTDVVWDWSPDGEILAVMAGNADKVFEHPTKGTYPLRQIYLVKPDGSGRELLTTGPTLDSIAACFSPDGTLLAYQERRHQEGRVRHFAVVKGRAQGKPRDLLQFNELFKGNEEFRPHGSPCWSPDGKSIVWLVPRRKVQSSETHPELVIVTLSTGTVDRLDLFQSGLNWVQAIDWR
jgi:Tol biopolymer transport system component